MIRDKTDLQPASLTWRPGNMPESNAFGDIYFNPEAGLGETRYVFLEGIGAPAVWQEAMDFSIGETGFGTGLNFLATWHLWRETARQGARLNYVSVEGFPLAKADLAKALAVWPELALEAADLIEAYPPLHPGFHRIELDGGRVSLTLLFGDVVAMLDQLSGPVDAWFLDGFAPSKNPDMWQPAVYAQLARLSKPGAGLATFTAAGHVRRGLADAGFGMAKMPGFGRKRECLRGRLVEPTANWNGRPWFAPPIPLPKGASVAVIGAGIAGVSVAQALQQAGYDCAIYERADRAATVGSGNHTGLVQPRLTAANSPEGRFNAASFLFAIRHYDRLDRTDPVWLPQRGVMQLARAREDVDRFNRLIAEKRLPVDQMMLLSPEQASEKAGIPIDREALYFPKAGALKPRALVPGLIGGCPVHYGRTIERLQREGTHWHLLDAAENMIAQADAVVIACGAFMRGLWPMADMPLHANRGQVAHVKASTLSAQLKTGLSCGGYICPPVEIDGEVAHVTGASYGNWRDDPAAESWRDLDPEDEQMNLDGLGKIVPNLGDLQPLSGMPGRAGLRATIPDHMPVMGPLPDEGYFDQNYGDLHHGKPARLYPAAQYHPGLYCLTGLASRGLQTAPFLASALVDLMVGRPCGLTRDFLEAVHPARFQIRRLQRRKRRYS
ncbi:bifunctional tRNA (5-methylaminomethyl-2-thiouridine)(34)-methyltransferase MnmD/FAD-dependent 5-carboxymethylaminomethyl-2-thiouridine(34) oxidoreductase MnmC [Aestuariispira insulae]|uniref:tRNA 5-methylaminomethyl-2-thiouridine biosynthesis bifunctional protein MnmC n=1 Tax=Aestuariispira insulae TaxID=1461337 RepID=A0A3D9H806_9PROT|nr:bifunctional tRNA (5-methylaminomethyl-2-thiouridine)(34)-methyltransferase MnmD/FAD-dependent 5-carboxymethylaminomethyl-2-thiouridine(34) oxidoreductase MnmC [Aestuariispira insulae]RED45096.1 tRNA 5-methylaminomethyl-2-thiouridine biosynthesis bifunctional protein [Aestuariispira insulae]